MRVVFNIPIRGKLRASFKTPILFDNWSFALVTRDVDEFVSCLIVEVSKIEKEYWPTIISAEPASTGEIPQFPFRVNDAAFGFNHFEENIIKLEGFLSLFGLEEFILGDVSAEWIVEDGDVVEQRLMSGIKATKQEVPVTTEPMTKSEFEICIIASQINDKQSATLSHYRMGLMHFRSQRYLDAIRNLYFAFENEFELTSGKPESIKRLSRNDFYKKSLSKFFSVNDQSISTISKKYNIDSKNVDPVKIGELIFNLRGSLQHSNVKSMKCWHPSKQSDFEDEAVCFLNFMDQICWDIVQSRTESVQNASATAKLD